jgi:hypothetical protein
MNQRVELGSKSRATLKIALISDSNLHFHFLHVFWCFCGVKFLQISHSIDFASMYDLTNNFGLN